MRLRSARKVLWNWKEVPYQWSLLVRPKDLFLSVRRLQQKSSSRWVEWIYPFRGGRFLINDLCSSIIVLCLCLPCSLNEGRQKERMSSSHISLTVRSSGPSKKGPGSYVRSAKERSRWFIRRTIHMEGSSPESGVRSPESAGFIRSPEDLSVGPSVINRSSPEDLSVGPSIWREGGLSIFRSGIQNRPVSIRTINSN